MFRLRLWQVWMATLVLSIGLTVVPGVAAGNNQTITGKVSDAMCGAKHTEGGIAPANCVRACVQKGAKYALVVGDKVYKLLRITPVYLRSCVSGRPIVFAIWAGVY